MLGGERADRLGDRLVHASIERAELVGRDGNAEPHRELRHRLAHVAVVVDDLLDREAGAPQLRSVHRRPPSDLAVGLARRGPLLAAQGLRELVEEVGDAVFELRLRRAGGGPCRDLHARARNQVVAVDGQELVEHPTLAAISTRGADPKLFTFDHFPALAGE